MTTSANAVLNYSVSSLTLLLTVLIIVAAGWGVYIRFLIHAPGGGKRGGTVSFPKEPSWGMSA